MLTRAAGEGIRFIPSDSEVADRPLPESVHRVADWVASIEDLDQLGVRAEREWMARGDEPPDT